MSERIDEHDMTKKMMEIMRGGYKGKLLTEDFGGGQAVSNAPVANQPQGNAATNQVAPNDVTDEPADNGTDADPATFKDELTKLTQIVDPSISISSFKLYPEQKNVTMVGTMFNGKADFTFNLADDDAIIEYAQPINLSDEKNEITKRMMGYFKNWKNDWSKKITTEYKTQ